VIVVEFRDVEKIFGRFKALKGLNFRIKKGERVAILGPNGSGKTTTVRLISGQIKPTSGTVSVFGKKRIDEDVKKRMGIVSHNPFLYDDLSAYENLKFFAKLYGVGEEKIRELLEEFGLWERRHDLVRNYSRGMKQRLSIARALLNNPELLILDEPTTGLDVEGRERLFGWMKGFNSTLIFTTHNFSEAERLCRRIMILKEGNLVFDGESGEIENVYQKVMK